MLASIRSLPIFARRRMSLSCNFVLLIIIILAVTMSVSAWLNYRSENQALLDQLETKGALLGNFVANVSQEAILGFDLILLEQYMEDITREQDIIYARIINTDQQNLAMIVRNITPYLQDPAPKSNEQMIGQASMHEDVIDMRFPIMFDEQLLGTVQIGMTKRRINAQSWSALKNQLLHSGLIILILSLAITSVFRRKALLPIQELIHSAECVARGELDHKVRVDSHDEFARLAESFNQMTYALKNSLEEKDRTMKQLRKATRAKSEFLANMSHEIRTPLTAILGYAETLTYPDTDSSTRKQGIEAILKNGSHLQRIINEILDLSKIEANRLEVEKIEVSPLKVVQDIEALVSMHAMGKGLKCSIQYKFPIPATILSDPIRIKQILLNLCNNAVKFTESGGITLEIGFDPGQNKLHMGVVDTGIGLGENEIKRIFDPFTQADSSTTRRYGGTGLGLTLSRQLARMLGGDLTVTSRRGEGSRFILTLDTGPVAKEQLIFREEDIPIRDDHARLTGDLAPQLSGEVLLAEDTVDNQRLLELQLRRIGARVTIVDNGQHAVEITQSRAFDLILMDMQMPLLDGLSAVEQIRDHGYHKPIVALTANAMKEFRDICIQAGCDDFISKPVEWEQFRLVLGRYLPVADTNTPSNPLYSTLIDDDAEFADIINGFLERLPGNYAAILQSRNTGDWNTCYRKVHELKGLGGAMGYPELSQAASELEVLLQDKQYDSLERPLEQLSKIIDRMQAGRTGSAAST